MNINGISHKKGRALSPWQNVHQLPLSGRIIQPKNHQLQLHHDPLMNHGTPPLCGRRKDSGTGPRVTDPVMMKQCGFLRWENAGLMLVFIMIKIMMVKSGFRMVKNG